MKKLHDTQVLGLIKGDHVVFRKIFNDNYQKLYHYAVEFIIDKEAAKEIVQDTFVKLWEIRTTIRSDSNLTALLYTIIRNKALNYLRQIVIQKKYQDSQKSIQSELELNFYTLNNDTFEKLVHDELHTALQNAIAALSPKCREVFELSRNEGLKYREIAEKLNISVNTVENHIAEALKKIRYCIYNYL